MSKLLDIFLCFESGEKAERLLCVLSVAGVLCDYKIKSSLTEIEKSIEKSVPVAFFCGFDSSSVSFETLLKFLRKRSLIIPVVLWTETGDVNYFYNAILTEHEDCHLIRIENLHNFCEDILLKGSTSCIKALNYFNMYRTESDNKTDDRTGILIETNERLQHEIKIRQKIEEELRKTDTFLNTILEHIPNAIFVKDAQSLKFTFINQYVTNMLGYTKEDMLTKTVSDIYSRELADYYMRKDKEALVTKGKLEIDEDIFLTKDNRIRIHNTKKILINDEQDSPKFILDITEDVTDKLRNENELRRVDMRFSKLFHSSPVGIVVVRLSDMEIIDANPSFLNLIEWTKPEILNLNFHSIDISEDEKHLKDLISTAKELGKFHTEEVCILTKTKKKLTVLVSVEFLNFEDDEPLIIFMFHDITERKKAEEEIQKALIAERNLNILKTRFIAMISHEFRTPLTSIMLSTDLLKIYSEKWNDIERMKHFNRIQSTVLTMTKLMENVLIIGRLESGDFEFNPVSVDLDSYCSNLNDNIEEIYMHDKQIVYVNNCPDTEIKLDENLLGLILNNLLTNAMKYSFKNGLVNFEVSCENGFVVFKISDYGIGIPLSDQEHIFDTFHRGSNTSSIAGYGLGLTIVERCVKEHKGTVEFSSEEGTGTTFIVKLPNLI